MPRLVRRQPLAERIKSYLNPLDFLLWLSEQIETSDWDQWEKDWALPLGIGLNTVFLIARANSKGNGSRAVDDVFGDDGGVSWLNWFASFTVHMLTLLSAFNAFYTFWRKRHYRMFEASIDKAPATPSAHRVRVDSSPVSSSPLRLISSVLKTESAGSRAHPDPQRDVWELAIWDPLPLSLRLFCLFSPGHVLVYWLFLPTLPSDPRPSVTIVTAIIVTILLSVQLSLLSSSFSQQAKDAALVHKEVLNEYDAKFVHPRTQPLMRNVGTQFSEEHVGHSGSDEKYNKVETFVPAHVIHRGFRTSPNPNYVSHIDPDKSTKSQSNFYRRQSSATSPSKAPIQTPSHLRDSSPIFQTTNSGIRQPQFRPTTGSGDGGSLGVYSHANSPLKKSGQFGGGAINFRDRAQSPVRKPSSPLKRGSLAGEMGAASTSQRWSHLSSDHHNARRESGKF
ncbi:hypothetical protein VTN02DRAFT_2777 [Thermoascus thermophilus]